MVASYLFAACGQPQSLPCISGGHSMTAAIEQTACMAADPLTTNSVHNGIEGLMSADFLKALRAIVDDGIRSHGLHTWQLCELPLSSKLQLNREAQPYSTLTGMCTL